MSRKAVLRITVFFVELPDRSAALLLNMARGVWLEKDKGCSDPRGEGKTLATNQHCWDPGGPAKIAEVTLMRPIHGNL